MRTIYKYPLDIKEHQQLQLPAKSIILHVALDPTGVVCAWIQVDIDQPIEPVDIYVIGTGHALPDEALIHVGSVVCGRFVWHVYAG